MNFFTSENIKEVQEIDNFNNVITLQNISQWYWRRSNKIAKTEYHKVKNIQDVTGMMLNCLRFLFICLFVYLFIYLFFQLFKDN